MAVALQMVVRGLDYDYVIIGMGVAALGLAFRPEPMCLPNWSNVIVAALSAASLAVFIAAWHSGGL